MLDSFTVNQVSRLTGLSDGVIYAWIYGGLLDCTPQWLIKREDLVCFFASRSHMLTIEGYLQENKPKVLVVGAHQPLLGYLSERMDFRKYEVQLETSAFVGGALANDCLPDCVVIDFVRLGREEALAMARYLKIPKKTGQPILIALYEEDGNLEPYFGPAEEALFYKTFKFPYPIESLGEAIQTSMIERFDW